MCNTILNTRPLSQSQQTAIEFKKHGFDVINFPCIEIAEIDDPINTQIKLSSIENNDVVIFTSQHAVKYAFKINPDWKIPKTSVVIPVGIKTAKVLEQYSDCDLSVPKQQNSQGVINFLKKLDESCTIKLISANNGRTKIQNYANENNIELEQINVYKRQIPKTDNDTVELIRRTNDLIVLATSITTLTNLKKLAGHLLWQKIQNCKLACASKRVQQHAKNLGFKDTTNIDSANPGIMAKKLTS